MPRATEMLLRGAYTALLSPDEIVSLRRLAPCPDIAAADAFWREHLEVIGLPSLPIDWMRDAEQAYKTTWSARESDRWLRRVSGVGFGYNVWASGPGGLWTTPERDARTLAEASAWRHGRGVREWIAMRTAASGAARGLAAALTPPFVDARARRKEGDFAWHVWRPFVELFRAGLWLWLVLNDRVLAVPRPRIHVDKGVIHRADGPAVEWEGGARYWAWYGVPVPEELILTPATFPLDRIAKERDGDVRHAMVERIAYYLLECDPAQYEVHRDRVGVLYRVDVFADTVALVEVENSTPEPDGIRQRHRLRVPPAIITAREAVAWTFGLSAADYRPTLET